MGTIKGTKGNDRITGTKRDDSIHSGDGADEVSGGLGNDRIFGGNGDDKLSGDAGNDSLYGEAGSDTMFGGDGDDYFDGGAGIDFMYGGAGADNFVSTGGDTVDGGDGDDTIMHLFNSTVKGGAGNDFFHFEGVGTTTVTDYVVGEVLGLGWNVNDANALLEGNQGWQYIGTSAPTSALANGNGQATVSYVDGYTVLELYDADGNFAADLTIRLFGTYEPQDINLLHHNAAAMGWTDPALLFG